MAWTTIANSTLAEGEPVRASTHLAIRDNIIAVPEGRPNAPRVSPWATAGVPVTAGTTIRYRNPAVRDLDITDFRIVWDISLANSGTVNVRWTTERTSGTGQVRSRLYRSREGSSAQQGSETTDSSETTHGRTVTIEPFDTLFIEARMQDSGATGYVKNVQIDTTGGLLYPADPWFRFGTAPV